MPPLEELSRQQSPRDRDLAASRLRSILTSAMDASRITAAASEAGPTRSNVRLPSSPVFPPDRRPPPPPLGSRSVPLPWNKLPEMTTTLSPLSSSMSRPTSPFAARSPTSSAEPRLGRLTPLNAPPRYSPRLEALSNSTPSQSNALLSTFMDVGGPRKLSPTYGSAK